MGAGVGCEMRCNPRAEHGKLGSVVAGVVEIGGPMMSVCRPPVIWCACGEIRSGEGGQRG